jgi:hypothetical protein
MPFTRRPLQSTVAFVVVNALLCISVGPVYDFVCDLPYWERRVCMYILSQAFCVCVSLSRSLSLSLSSSAAHIKPLSTVGRLEILCWFGLGYC